jgi:CDP-6-deoxy-D-xylo-4-hexulose-3-dehydrase
MDKSVLLDKSVFTEEVAEMTSSFMDSVVRAMVKGRSTLYYEKFHKPIQHKEFIQGKDHIPYAGRVYDEKEMVTLVDSALDFWLTAGRYAKQFEEELAKFLGAKYCLLTNSGSSANLLAISALTSPKLGERRLKPEDEVITTACGFPTTVNPIIQNNLIPVFIDVNLGTYNIQVDKIEEALTEKTKAIFLAHTLGNPFNLDKISEICEEYNIWLIEDNCDALGSKYKGRYTGTFGHIATFSFYPAHHITMGEGGALVTNDTQLKRLIASFRDWGRDCWCEPGHDNTCGKRFGWQLGSLPYGYDHKYIYTHVGYNLKITDMQAAIGVAQLDKLPDFIEARKRNHKKLYDGLKELEDKILLPKPQENSEPSWFGFLITLKDGIEVKRDDVTSKLEDCKIQTRLLFAGNMIRHPVFDEMRKTGKGWRVVGDLKNTDKVMNDSFWIGVYPGMTDETIDYILDKIKNFFQENDK